MSKKIKLKYTKYSHCKYSYIDISWDHIKQFNYNIKEKVNAEKHYYNKFLKQLFVI